MSDISVNAAKDDKLFYVVANFAIVNRYDKTVLLLKRSKQEKVFPDMWAFPGGKLEHRDVAEMLESQGTDALNGIENILGELARRETKEECGLDIRATGNEIIKNKVFIRPDKVPVFMVTLVGRYESGDVRLEESSHSAYMWAGQDDIDSLGCIPGVREEAIAALKLPA